MLDLPTDPRTAAVKTIIQRLKNDSVLSRVVRKWHTYSPKLITLADLPYVLIQVKSGPIRVKSPQAHSNPLLVNVDYVVSASGTDEETAWADAINLYGQIEKAVNPFASDLSWLRDPIHAVDPTVVIEGPPTFLQPGYTSATRNDVNVIEGMCVISFPLKINTCRS